jgi:hypothetical protein
MAPIMKQGYNFDNIIYKHQEISEKVLQLIDSFMSVSTFTHADETVALSTSKLFFSKPYESLCRENFSPLFKHLKAVNPNKGQGLESLIDLD